MPMPNGSLPNDDIQASEQSEQALLDAVLQSSEFTKDLYEEEVPLPEEHELVDDTVDVSDEDDQDELTDIDTEEETEEFEDEELDEDADDEDATQDADIYTADDLDLEAKVRVKVDGEELDVSFADLLKGYQTDASLSKKGRELGDAKKEIEAEREKALAEAREVAEASAAVLMGQEQNLAREYHELEAKIEKARDEGDTFEVSELKDKREQVQKKFWKAKQEREGIQTKVKEQQTAEFQKHWDEQVKHFNENIESFVPGFNQDTASEIRKFAISEGLSENVVDSIVDPVVVKLLNDYRTLKQGVKKGEAKRKAAPTKKAVPAKKAKSASQKKAAQANMTKARAFRDDASPEDQMAFLRDYAAKSLGDI